MLFTCIASVYVAISFSGLHSYMDMCMSGIVVEGGINLGSMFIS